MTVSIFVDTTILLYARDASEPEKQPLAAAWLEALWDRQCGRLSFQVLEECYTRLARKTAPAMDRHEARRYVASFLAWRPVPVDGQVIETAWAVEDRFSLPWADCLIVAAAQVAGSAYILSEALPHWQDFGGVKVASPFRLRAEALLGPAS
ncbi:MAG: PIN domain-containing protein [Hyphomicrobiaceae bacterium]|nr:PIN domain-containing protein [Hyphomicrobiaceae bacterium]